jgi:hypothetical protein
MAEILRLFDGPNNAEDWHVSSAYSSGDIKKIKDPAEGTMKEITSIPSPFARIHLFEHAFKVISDQATQDPNTLNNRSMFHKLVSDCLDVGEAFFNYDILLESTNHNLKIVTWNKNNHLNNLITSNNSSHKLLGETLDLFLKQDTKGSNFHRMENIHLMKCNYKTIIGGTSPSTLFFASHNDDFNLSNLNLRQGNDLFFDKDFRPLTHRNIEYQKYLHGLFKVNSELRGIMIDFHRYLEASLKYLKNNENHTFKSLMEYLDTVTEANQFYNTFQKLEVNNATSTIEFFPGIPLGKNQSAEIQNRGKNSDFAIKSDLNNEEKPPLILSNGFNKPWNYFGGVWGSEYNIPYLPEEEIGLRTLPGVGMKYPYLTTSDFLEPYLIQMEYQMNKDHFFTGNPINFIDPNREQMNYDMDPHFLLPLKPLFFKYFNISKLKETTGDGKKIFSIKKIDGNTFSVELRIPVNKANEYITLERTYKRNISLPNEFQNEGKIVVNKMNLAFLPFFFVENIPNMQYVGVIDNDILDDTIENEYSLGFYNCGNLLEIRPQYNVQKSDKRKHQRNVSSKYYILDSSYDYITVNSGKAKGIVVPFIKKKSQGTEQFTFAIDFGTTNTHIEYAKNNESPVAFNINENDLQLNTLLEQKSDWYYSGLLKDILLHEFIPNLIGPNQQFSFPIRTVTTEIESLDHNINSKPIADINISFVYEKLQVLNNSKIQTNLKWQNFETENNQYTSRLQAFLSELIILIRNKVILNNGKLSDTKIIWFYPSSMTSNHINIFNNTWEDLVSKYLGITDTSQINKLSEATVPYYMHNDLISSGTYPAVNIDIGGGTTDIAIFKNEIPEITSSAIFAGNTVWGDGFTETPANHNGIVRFFDKDVKEFLEANIQNGLNKLYETYKQIRNNQSLSSADMISFFFSVDKNKEVKNKNLSFNFFQLLLKKQNFKILFLVFYYAIIYYTARLMKLSNLDCPKYIVLSGNGSRIFKLLDSSNNYGDITALAKYIFEKVYKTNYHAEGLKIVQHAEPKESTCKGGIKALSKNEISNFDSLIWIGDNQFGKEEENEEKSEGTLVIKGKLNNNNYNAKSLKYNEITEEVKNNIIKEYNAFIDLIKEGNSDFNFNDLFGIKNETFEEYLKILREDSKDNLVRGINSRNKTKNGMENISETLFFYPVIGGLYKLNNKIANDLGV